MIAWLLKNWKLFVDIVVVVTAIVLFSMFDPFGVFSKRTLKSTATILSGVKSIGELVTAEYYGEVISSLHGTQVYDLKPDILSQEFEDCFIEIKSQIVNDILNELGEQTELTKRQIKRLTKKVTEENYFSEIKIKYNNNHIYNHLITFLCVKNIRNKTSAFYDKKSVNPLKSKASNQIAGILLNETLNILKELSETDRAVNDAAFSQHIYLLPPYFSEIIEFHYNLNEEDIKKPRHDIVFIGRGWVKAGFKFKQLNKSNFYYDEGKHVIHFFGLSPEILDNDINPWFIPEKRIKGFELVDFYQKATFEEAKTVKIRCKQELLDQARNAGILEQAKINGTESLQNFFALLTDTPDLQVIFHDIPYKSELNIIKADSLITVKEALLIDSIISRETKKISHAISPEKEQYIEQLAIFMNQFEGTWFVRKGIPFHHYMIEAAKVLHHKRFITPDDSLFICTVRDTIRTNKSVTPPALTTNYLKKLEYESYYPVFVKQFNEMLKFLEEEITVMDDFREDTLTLTPTQCAVLNLNSVFFDFDTIYNQNNFNIIDFIKVKHKIPRKFAFTDFQYPDFSIPTGALDTISIMNLKSVDLLFNSLRQHMDLETQDSIYNSLRKSELDTIINFKSEEIKLELEKEPARKLARGIQKFFGKN